MSCYHRLYDNYILNGKCCICDKPANMSYNKFREQLNKELQEQNKNKKGKENV